MGPMKKAEKPEPTKNMYDEDAEMLAAEQAAYDATQAAAPLIPAELPVTGDSKIDQLLITMGQLLLKQSEALDKIANRSEAGPTPQIPFAQAKWQTPWNPTGERYARLLKRTVRLNGHRLSEITMSQPEIDALNDLKPGRYNDRKWTVIEEDGGADGSAINIYLPNHRPEQRMENTIMAKGQGLMGVLGIMLSEQRAVRLS